MKQLISTLLLIGCLVACDPGPELDHIASPQKTTKSNPIVTNKSNPIVTNNDQYEKNLFPQTYKNSVIVCTSDSTDQFVFSIYPENKMEDDKTSIIMFPPKEQVKNENLVNQFEFESRTNPELFPRTVPENKKLVIKLFPLRDHNTKYRMYRNYSCRLQYFQNTEELNHYTNETEEMVVGVYSNKYTAEDILFYDSFIRIGYNLEIIREKH